MHQTKDRNGILFYLALKSKSFAVWGDEGIHQKVNDEFWTRITDCALTHFKNGDFLEVLARIRYRQDLQRATLYQFESGLYVCFNELQAAISSGQFVAWNIDDELVGSGVIS
jgi:tRNA U34 2-thiouridine synthase MnmA/TrmU